MQQSGMGTCSTRQAQGCSLAGRGSTPLCPHPVLNLYRPQAPPNCTAHVASRPSPHLYCTHASHPGTSPPAAPTCTAHRKSGQAAPHSSSCPCTSP
jgi:hypothetical protein